MRRLFVSGCLCFLSSSVFSHLAVAETIQLDAPLIQPPAQLAPPPPVIPAGGIPIPMQMPAVGPVEAPPPAPPVNCDTIVTQNLSIGPVCSSLRNALADEKKRETLLLVDSRIVAICDFILQDAEMVRVLEHYLPLLNDDDFDTRQSTQDMLVEVCRGVGNSSSFLALIKALQGMNDPENQCPELNYRLGQIAAKCEAR